MVSTRERVLLVAATAGAGTLFYFGTGLHPVWLLTWLAPLPLLVLAPRASARATAVMSFAAWLLGEGALWTYYTGADALSQPVPVVVALFVGTAALFAAVVLGARALMRSGHLVAAAVFVPAAWTVVELAVSRLTPNGLFWSLSYTQVDVLPVLQLVSVTGPWGITFLVLGLPATMAAMLAPRATSRARLPMALVTVLVLALVGGYGTIRPHLEPVGRRLAVGVLALGQPSDPVPLSSPAGAALLRRYVVQADRLVDAGARVVVLPEKGFSADARTLHVLTAPLRALSARRHVDLVVGLVLTRGGLTHNSALVFPAGRPPLEYDKQHLVPVLEDSFTPGGRLTLVAGSTGTWGVAICKDMDFPGLVRDYRHRGARLLLVPAWDFNRDAWLHSRMAVMRGVEEGVPVVRAARDGAVTASDSYGRVLTEARTSGRPVASGAALLPTRAPTTVYSILGDWFAWICLAGVAVIAGCAVKARRRWSGRLRAGR